MEITFKHRYKLLGLFFFSSLILASCKKSERTDNSNKPVVIGYLVPGQPITVKVYEQKGLSDTATYGAPIGGLQLKISDGNKTVALSETSTGVYAYNDVTFLATGKTYSLQFTYNGTNVTASTVMPGKPTGFTTTKTLINLPAGTTFTPGEEDSIAVTFRWKNLDSLNHVLVFKNEDSDPFKLKTQFNSQPNFTINPKKAEYYDVHQRTLDYLGIYDVILFRVNQEYIDALTTNANTTSQKLTDPPTNVTNGYGIFTAMQADTIKVQVTSY